MKSSIVLTLLCLALPGIGWAQEEDEIVREAFVQAFGASPLASRSVNPAPSPETAAAIAAGREAVASPSDRALKAEFADQLGSAIGAHGGNNILELLSLVLRESIADMQEDKKHYLEKLAGMNKMGEALSDYLEELARASRELGVTERGSTGHARSRRTVPITVRTFDPVWLEALAESSDRGRGMICDPCLTTRAATLNAEQIQREQETILGVQRRLQTAREATGTRHAELERQSAAVAGMLAEVLKVVDEEQNGAIRRQLDALTP